MELDGIVTFMSSYQALRAEKAAQAAGVTAKLVPAPRDLSPTCVTALRFPWSQSARVEDLLAAQRVEIDRCCQYPETQNQPKGWASLLKRH